MRREMAGGKQSGAGEGRGGRKGGKGIYKVVEAEREGSEWEIGRAHV